MKSILTVLVFASVYLLGVEAHAKVALCGG